MKAQLAAKKREVREITHRGRRGESRKAEKDEGNNHPMVKEPCMEQGV
jgi:hypothetical protein